MKKTYMIPTLQVVKIQPAQFIANSLPQVAGDDTPASSGNLGREATISDDEWFEE